VKIKECKKYLNIDLIKSENLTRKLDYEEKI